MIRYLSSKDRIKYKSKSKPTEKTLEPESKEPPRLLVGEYCFSDDVSIIYDSCQLIQNGKVLFEYDHKGFQLSLRSFEDIGFAIKEAMMKYSIPDYVLENGRRQKNRNGKIETVKIGGLTPKKLKILETILNSQ